MLPDLPVPLSDQISALNIPAICYPQVARRMTALLTSLASPFLFGG